MGGRRGGAIAQKEIGRAFAGASRADDDGWVSRFRLAFAGRGAREVRAARLQHAADGGDCGIHLADILQDRGAAFDGEQQGGRPPHARNHPRGVDLGCLQVGEIPNFGVEIGGRRHFHGIENLAQHGIGAAAAFLASLGEDRHFDSAGDRRPIKEGQISAFEADQYDPGMPRGLTGDLFGGDGRSGGGQPGGIDADDRVESEFILGRPQPLPQPGGAWRHGGFDRVVAGGLEGAKSAPPECLGAAEIVKRGAENENILVLHAQALAVVADPGGMGKILGQRIGAGRENRSGEQQQKDRATHQE